MSRCISAFMICIAATGIAAPVASTAAKFNDTGLTECLVDGAYTRECVNTGQDARFGRDTGPNKADNGIAGFKFTKISATGKKLSPDAPAWDCVKDEVTGLTWEVKSKAPGLRYEQNFYTNQTGKNTDVQIFAQEVNNIGLCGAHDWRIPSRNEANSLASYALVGGDVPQGLDRGYFADSSSREWTSTCVRPSYPVCVMTPFTAGDYVQAGPEDAAQSRLVRGKSIDPGEFHFSTNESLATNKQTGLIWRRCSEGQQWTDRACSGSATRHSWSQALALAQKTAAQTGETWRLPNVKELLSLVKLPRNPAIDRAVFPQTPNGYFWSSSISTQLYPWSIDFYHGVQSASFFNAETLMFVRLVRSTD